MDNTLPNDIARCDGRYEPIDKRHEMLVKECRNCLRRTAPRHDPYWNMEPPTFEGKCPKKIEPKENNGN